MFFIIIYRAALPFDVGVFFKEAKTAVLQLGSPSAEEAKCRITMVLPDTEWHKKIFQLYYHKLFFLLSISK